MEKVIRNGEVAVLYSPGYGAGWSTWNSYNPLLIFSPVLVEMVEKGKRDELTDEVTKQLLGIPEEEHLYCGGANQLKILWVPEGTRFEITEYNGAENVRFLDPTIGFVA